MEKIGHPANPHKIRILEKVLLLQLITIRYSSIYSHPYSLKRDRLGGTTTTIVGGWCLGVKAKRIPIGIAEDIPRGKMLVFARGSMGEGHI